MQFSRCSTIFEIKNVTSVASKVTFDGLIDATAMTTSILGSLGGCVEGEGGRRLHTASNSPSTFAGRQQATSGNNKALGVQMSAAWENTQTRESAARGRLSRSATAKLTRATHEEQNMNEAGRQAADSRQQQHWCFRDTAEGEAVGWRIYLRWQPPTVSGSPGLPWRGEGEA